MPGSEESSAHCFSPRAGGRDPGGGATSGLLPGAGLGCWVRGAPTSRLLALPPASSRSPPPAEVCGGRCPKERPEAAGTRLPAPLSAESTGPLQTLGGEQQRELYMDLTPPPQVQGRGQACLFSSLRPLGSHLGGGRRRGRCSEVTVSLLRRPVCEESVGCRHRVGGLAFWVRGAHTWQVVLLL